MDCIGKNAFGHRHFPFLDYFGSRLVAALEKKPDVVSLYRSGTRGLRMDPELGDKRISETETLTDGNPDSHLKYFFKI